MVSDMLLDDADENRELLEVEDLNPREGRPRDLRERGYDLRRARLIIKYHHIAPESAETPLGSPAAGTTRISSLGS